MHWALHWKPKELMGFALEAQNVDGACMECPKSFKQKEKLVRHVQCVHEKLKPFQCQFCQVTFSRKDKLKRHVSSIHLKERPYICNHCDFQTNRKDRIKQHVTGVHATHGEDFTYQPGNTKSTKLMEVLCS